jgi:hypothetical protein
MQNHNLNALVEALKSNSKLKKHSQLKSGNWSKSAYQLASEIISTELEKLLTNEEQQRFGTTISGKTLSNMVTGDYRMSDPLDPRTLATLTKVVRFLGYPDWEAFSHQASDNRNAHLTELAPEQVAINTLEEALLCEFHQYQSLPVLNPESLHAFFAAKSPAFRKIMDQLQHYSNQGVGVSNLYNPSTVDLITPEVLSATETKVRIKAKVYWLLCFWDDNQSRYVKRYKSIEDYYYQLEKKDENWLITRISTLSDALEASDIKPNEITETPTTNSADTTSDTAPVYEANPDTEKAPASKAKKVKPKSEKPASV